MGCHCRFGGIADRAFCSGTLRFADFELLWTAAGRIWNQVFPKPAEVQPRIAVTPVPSPVAAVPPAPVPAPAVTVAQNRPTSPSSGKPAPAVPASSYNTHFKEFGSPTAPITVEVYTDYECPACAVLYQQAIPMLVSQYVQTGKVKMLHRDFPLTQHPYARLAARFANAAGWANTTWW